MPYRRNRNGRRTVSQDWSRVCKLSSLTLLKSSNILLDSKMRSVRIAYKFDGTNRFLCWSLSLSTIADQSSFGDVLETIHEGKYYSFHLNIRVSFWSKNLTRILFYTFDGFSNQIRIVTRSQSLYLTGGSIVEQIFGYAFETMRMLRRKVIDISSNSWHEGFEWYFVS